MSIVTVIGAGPSGLMCAHAATQFGYDIRILDKNPDRSRRNSGVYYLHSDCDLLLDEITIKQTVLGAKGKTREEIATQYGIKVYGEEVPKVSILEALDTPVIKGYNAGQAIDRLWDLYGHNVIEREIAGLDDLYELKNDVRVAYVISTIPIQTFFPTLNFPYKKAWMKVGKSPLNESFIFYNLNKYVDWYRCSALLGTFVQEFGHDVPMRQCEDHEAREVIKVIDGDRPPEIDRVLFVGRFGSWNKRSLTHSVYYETLEWLKSKKNI